MTSVQDMLLVLLVLLALTNLAAFAAFGVDKKLAKTRGARRVRERTLMLYAACFGGIGALIGMRVFHHKTQKTLFNIGVPVLIVAQAAAVYALFVFAGR